MTDNEKAATFIGWRERQMCTAPVKSVDPYEFGDVWCPACDEVFGCGSHDVVCPDMSKPENYMRALETVKRFEPELWWNNDRGFAVCTIEAEHPVTGITYADAITKALAALYDIEHKG